jgi:hypothetical protein
MATSLYMDDRGLPFHIATPWRETAEYNKPIFLHQEAPVSHLAVSLYPHSQGSYGLLARLVEPFSRLFSVLEKDVEEKIKGADEKDA